MQDIYEKVLGKLLNEFSTMSGGAVGGVSTPLGAGPKAGSRGEDIYKKSDATDKQYRFKNKDPKKKTYVRSVQWYLKNGGKKSKINEQNATKCLTSGAQFHIQTTPQNISVKVDFPFELDLDINQSIELETLLHNAVELVLSRYWDQ